ncbi:MAG: hypothetical protein ACRC62_12800 [Microcoleus sp.]
MLHPEGCAIDYQLPTTNYQLPITNYQLITGTEIVTKNISKQYNNNREKDDDTSNCQR